MKTITKQECSDLLADGIGFCSFMGRTNFDSPKGLIMEAGGELVHFEVGEVETHPEYFAMTSVQSRESADFAQEYESGRIVRGKIIRD